MNKPSDILGRFIYATNRHDIDGMLSCFAEDYRAEYPGPILPATSKGESRCDASTTSFSPACPTSLSCRSGAPWTATSSGRSWSGVARVETIRGSLCAVRSCSVSVMVCSPGFVAISSQWTRRQSPRRSAEANVRD